MKVSKGRIIFQCINYTVLFLLMAAALYPVLYVLAASFSSFEFLAQGKVGIIPMGFTIDAYKRIWPRIYKYHFLYGGRNRNKPAVIISGGISSVEASLSGAEVYVQRNCCGHAFQCRNDSYIFDSNKIKYV